MHASLSQALTHRCLEAVCIASSSIGQVTISKRSMHDAPAFSLDHLEREQYTPLAHCFSAVCVGNFCSVVSASVINALYLCQPSRLCSICIFDVWRSRTPFCDHMRRIDGHNCCTRVVNTA